MSVHERLDDAKHLWTLGRRTGALLSVLVATAATSRKRFPRRKHKKGQPGKPTDTDRGAFEAFVQDALHKAIRVENFNVAFRGKVITLQALLYEYVRCELAHEAVIPQDVEFFDELTSGLAVHVLPDRVRFSTSLIDILMTAVRNAPENQTS